VSRTSEFCSFCKRTTANLTSFQRAHQVVSWHQGSPIALRNHPYYSSRLEDQTSPQQIFLVPSALISSSVPDHHTIGAIRLRHNQLAGQTIDYSRGKGLGGSTAINFCGWTVGARDDFDEYAELVGDDRFGWDNVKKSLRRIERVHLTVPDERLRKYVNAKPEGMGPHNLPDEARTSALLM
jgi:choline dehydrogenase-like flavoprotein